MNFETLEHDYNFMVIDLHGSKYRTYKYDRAKTYLESNGGRLYAYFYDKLKTRTLLIEWKM